MLEGHDCEVWRFIKLWLETMVFLLMQVPLSTIYGIPKRKFQYSSVERFYWHGSDGVGN